MTTKTASRHVVILRALLTGALALLVIDAFIVRHLSGTADTMDYRSFYAAGYLERTNPARLYDLPSQIWAQNHMVSQQVYALPYFHPPYEIWLYAPFTFLPYLTSYYAFLGLNSILLLSAILALPQPRIEAFPMLRVAPELLYISFLPVLMALRQGQDSILYLLLSTLAWRAWQRDRTLVCGGLLGVTLFRFQLTVPLIALLLIRRRSWSLLGGFLCSAALVAMASWLTAGQEGCRAFVHLLFAGSLSRDHGLASQFAMAIHPLAMPNVYGLLARMGLQRLSPGHGVELTLIVSAAVFLIAAIRIRRARTSEEAFAIAVLCSLALSYHMYLHDLTLLVLALVLLGSATAFSIGFATYVLAVAILRFHGNDSLCWLSLPVLLLLFSWTGVTRGTQAWFRQLGTRAA